MKTFLVTGVAGFIASRVAELLLDAGHSVVGVDNLNAAYDVRMKEYRLGQLRGREHFSFHKMDISDKCILEMEEFKEPTFEAVINLAARAGVRASVENPWVYVDTNMTGTLNLLELCQRNDIPKFILASTSSIYGSNAPLPTPETADSAHPLQAYAASKKGAEAMAHAYYYLYDIDVSVVRYFTVYGPAGRPDMVMFRFNKWIKEGTTLRLNGDGEQSRGFTYVDDIARGTIAALKPVGYEVINLGGHEVITINELIKILERHTGQKAKVKHYPMHPADARANQASVDKAQNLLGWEPRISLEEGIGRMVAWYDENREWVKEIDTN
ncbi:MAG: UDP-N-acetylglucosamine 4-epimerase [Chloroflexi bacterium]|nr:UDP-N-acetylglucosamine 4-epimerase [Chloroflexota bacterium]